MNGKTEYQPSESDGMEEYIMQEQAQRGGKIFAAMVAVMKGVGAIGKDRKNQHFKYNFRGIDDVMNALHKPLTDNGIFFVPIVESSEYVETEYQNNSGYKKLQTHCRLRVRYRFFADDGSTLDAVGVGEGVDDSDKATNKAMSAAMKYALLQTFCVPTEDMADADGEPVERQPPAKAKPKNNRPESRAELITKCESMFAKLMMPFERWDALVRLVTGNKYGSWQALKKQPDGHLRALATKLHGLWTENRVDGEYVSESLIEQIEENEAKQEQK